MRIIAHGLLMSIAASLTTPVFGQSSAAKEASENPQLRNGLEEVIVTAQKRAARLIETPISIGVLSGAMLDHSSSRGVSDILNQVGGVSVTEIQPGQTQIVVRGAVPGIGSSTTALYMDEVPYGFTRLPDVADANSFDLQRVEVLRGPQGTLYGANSLSGVVRILTNDADLDAFQLKGRTRAFSTDNGEESYGGDFAINVPLIPGTLAVRAVGGYSELGGFLRSTADGRRDINDTRAQNYRVKVNWQVSENLNAKLGYSRSEIKNSAPSYSYDDYTTIFSANQPDERVLNVYSLVAEYQWPSVSLLSATGYTDYTAANVSEFLVSPFTVSTGNEDRIKSAFSQELRFVSRLQGPWQWSAGAFYRDIEQDRSQDVLTPQLFDDFLPGVFRQGALSESYAVFGELTRTFGDGKYDLTAGVRYFNDRETVQDLGSFDPSAVLLPDSSAEYDKVTGRLVLNYKPRSNTTFYGSVASGFRSGAQQSPETLRSDPSFGPAEPDKLTSYELGAKGRLFDGALAYETAVYYMDWEGIQQLLTLPPPRAFGVRVNAGSASGLGVDATLSYQATRALNLWMAVGWNNLQLDDDVFHFDVESQQNLALFKEGGRLNDSPEWTGSGGAIIRVATSMMAGADLVMEGTYTYGSARVGRFVAAGAITETQSDELASLKVSIGFESERWSAEAYGDNLLNENAGIDPPFVSNANMSIRQRPRTVGLQVTFKY